MSLKSRPFLPDRAPWSGIFLRNLLWVLAVLPVLGQNFVLISDPANPIVTDTLLPSGNYTGSSWQDWDNDGDLDLLATNNILYRNDGDGNFTRLQDTAVGAGFLSAPNGSSFGDYDNDGDLDVFVASFNSFLYRNNGDGTFTKIEAGTIAEANDNRGVSCAFVDVNNDGNLDIFVVKPGGVFRPPTPPHLLINDGPPNYSFTRFDGDPLVTHIGVKWTGTWSDYDMDGDMDVFIGAGPSIGGQHGPNLFYHNLFSQTGMVMFEQVTEGSVAEDLLDTQMLNLIDFDNDGDFDCFATNWRGITSNGSPNVLYRQTDGEFTSVSAGDLTNDSEISISGIWGDYDNDTDLDVYVSGDVGSPDQFYRNNGEGSFENIAMPSVNRLGTNYGGTAGDYDNDGDLDIYIYGPIPLGSATGSSSALLNNRLENGNHWIFLDLEGVASNRSAIGARVRARVTLNGQEVWQLREVRGQTTYSSQDALAVHFGLGDATLVELLEITWPSGAVDVHQNLAVDQRHRLVEGLTGAEEPTQLFMSWISNRTDSFESVIIINNYGAEEVEVTLSARRTEGEPEQVTRTIPANGFLEESAAALFAGLGSGGGYSLLITAAGDKIEARWVTNNLEAASEQSPSQGVAVKISGDEADMRVGQELLYGFLPVTDGLISAPVVCNVGAGPTQVTLRFFDRAGAQVNETVLVDLEPFRPFAEVANSLVPAGEDVYMTASSSGEPITGVSFVFSAAFGEAAIGNVTAVDLAGADMGAKTLLYPWISNRAELFESIVILNNYADQEVSVNLTARRESGDPDQATRTIPAHGFLKETASSLFPALGDGAGYALELNSPSSKVDGLWVTNSLRAQSGRSPSQAVAIDISPSSLEGSNRVGSDLLFGYLPITNNFTSAPVLVNAGAGDTDVSLFFYDHDGNQIASTQATLTALSPYRPFARIVNDLLPEGTGNVYMIARSNGEPITGVAFVFNTVFSEPAIGNASVISPDP